MPLLLERLGGCVAADGFAGVGEAAGAEAVAGLLPGVAAVLSVVEFCFVDFVVLVALWSGV